MLISDWFWLLSYLECCACNLAAWSSSFGSSVHALFGFVCVSFVDVARLPLCMCVLLWFDRLMGLWFKGTFGYATLIGHLFDNSSSVYLLVGSLWQLTIGSLLCEAEGHVLSGTCEEEGRFAPSTPPQHTTYIHALLSSLTLLIYPLHLFCVNYSL